MALRMVLVTLVACLGLELDSDPNRECHARGARSVSVEPSTARWIRERVAQMERELRLRASAVTAPNPATPEPGYQLSGVAGTGLAWPGILAEIGGLTQPISLPISEELAVEPVLTVDAFRSPEVSLIEEVEESAQSTDNADALFTRVVTEIASQLREQVRAEQPLIEPDHEQATSVAAQTVDNPDAQDTQPEDLGAIAPSAPFEDEVDLLPVAEAISTSSEVTEDSAGVQQDSGRSVEQPASMSRFVRALRLTGQACEAWADILETNSTPAVSSQAAADRTVR